MQMKQGMIRWMSVVVAALAAGCATTGYQKAEQSALSMNDTKVELQQGNRQITVAIKSLDTVMNAQVGDLRPLFKDFESNVDAIKAEAASARARAATMQEKNRAYFATWAQDIEQIQNPQVKAQSLKRYNAAKASYAKVEEMLVKLGEEYRPLMGGLADLQTALGQDLTQSGLNAVRPSYNAARKQAIELQSVIKQTLTAIDSASHQLMPVATGAGK